MMVFPFRGGFYIAIVSQGSDSPELSKVEIKLTLPVIVIVSRMVDDSIQRLECLPAQYGERHSLPFEKAIIDDDTNKRLGCVWPTWCLSRDLEVNDFDVVIVASDDYSPPLNWDQYLRWVVQRGFVGVVVNDGIFKGKGMPLSYPLLQAIVGFSPKTLEVPI